MDPGDVFTSTQPMHPSTLPPPTTRAGEVFAGRFELERLAGAGGMGAVWRALDRRSGEPVALKVMLNQHEQQVARFRREAHLLAELQHPGIAQHVDHGVTEDGRHYLAMEWLEGEDLAARIARGTLSIDESITLLERVAEALAVVHARGVIHRDLKPANLFLPAGDTSQVKVLDFGIAREPDPVVITAEGLVLGTPAYMAPERVQGDPNIDARADIFSLGCVLYECLVGRPAFDGPHVLAVLAKIMVHNPDLYLMSRHRNSYELEALVRLMLSKMPSRRPADGSAIVQLMACLRDGSKDAHRRFQELVIWPQAKPSFLVAPKRPVVLYCVAMLMRPGNDVVGPSVGAASGHVIKIEGGSLVLSVSRVTAMVAVSNWLRRWQLTGHGRVMAFAAMDVYRRERESGHERRGSPEEEVIELVVQLMDRTLGDGIVGVVTDAETASLIDTSQFEILGQGDVLELRLIS